MISRSIYTIFAPSGRPVPSEDEVLMEARDIVNRRGWGMPLIESLRRIHDPYWREAIARCLMDMWNEMVREKDEQTYYYDMDGDVRLCWVDAEYDFSLVIRKSTDEQVEVEMAQSTSEEAKTAVTDCTLPNPTTDISLVPPANNQTINIYITQNNAPIITESHVTIHSEQ